MTARVFSSGDTTEQPLCVNLSSVWNRQKWLILHFTRAQVDAPIDLKVFQIPCTIDSWRDLSGQLWRTHIRPWSRYVTSRTSSLASKKWRKCTMGSGSSPSSSGNSGGSGRSMIASQVAVLYHQRGVLRSALNKPIVPCLISWTTLPEPIANQTPLCAMQ